MIALNITLFCYIQHWICQLYALNFWYYFSFLLFLQYGACSYPTFVWNITKVLTYTPFDDSDVKNCALNHQVTVLFSECSAVPYHV